jgi:organic hydroperoxide reductase OsmC/OhrA
VTITALAEREQLPLGDLSVKADGVVGRRPGGHFGCVRIEQKVDLTTDAGYEDAARALVAKAEEGCLVTVSLDVPVQTTVRVGALIEAG